MGSNSDVSCCSRIVERQPVIGNLNEPDVGHRRPRDECIADLGDEARRVCRQTRDRNGRPRAFSADADPIRHEAIRHYPARETRPGDVDSTRERRTRAPLGAEGHKRLSAIGAEPYAAIVDGLRRCTAAVKRLVTRFCLDDVVG